jgi:hypothetical protein
MKRLNKETRDKLKEVIKNHYKSEILKEKKDEEVDISNDEEIEDNGMEGNEEASSGGSSSEIENALNVALEAATAYGDPKLSTLLNNAKIYLARSLSKKV